MGIRLDKPWQRLDNATIDALPSQLGVYHVADTDGTVLSVGYAGAVSRSACSRRFAGKSNSSAKPPRSSGASSPPTTGAAGMSCSCCISPTTASFPDRSATKRSASGGSIRLEPHWPTA